MTKRVSPPIMRCPIRSGMTEGGAGGSPEAVGAQGCGRSGGKGSVGPGESGGGTEEAEEKELQKDAGLHLSATTTMTQRRRTRTACV